MFLLDTNVVSELRRPARAGAGLLAWAQATPIDELYLSAVVIFEIESGLLLLERRDRAQAGRLRAWFETHVLGTFLDRILAVDLPVARCCAGLHVPNPRPMRDSQIAATAIVHGMTVVTRNVADFAPMGVALLNP